MSGIVVTSSGMADAPFTLNPAQYDPSLTNFAGSLTLDYRTVERDAQGNIGPENGSEGQGDFRIVLAQYD